MKGKEIIQIFPDGNAVRKNLKRLLLIFSIALLVTGFSSLDSPYTATQPPPALPSPTPTDDPLAIPVLPENPTEFDLGKHSYYYNCMPCHGGHGEGLTDEWRQTWVEDHRNCWERGCHGGREKDEGFPLPTIVPAVILDSGALREFAQPEDLVTYLRTTHPPQSPGVLAEDDYRALVAYLWTANGKVDSQAVEDPALSSSTIKWTRAAALALAGIIVFALIGLVYFTTRQKNSR